MTEITSNNIMQIINNAPISRTESLVEMYLESFLERPQFGRKTCCESSQSLYCKSCCGLLVPDDSLPCSIRLRKRADSEDIVLRDSEKPLKLPFDLHIILDDRRGSSTGIHAVALLEKEQQEIEIDSRASAAELGSVKLVDVTNDEIPNYQDGDGTFILFPSPGESVPIETVATEINTLVALDCKWTKTSIHRKKALSQLPKVHLSSPPERSYYWRWHNMGPGMISTIEAIYYAAYEVSQIKSQQSIETNVSSQYASTDETDQNNLLDLLWLFGHQRAATLKSAKKAGKPPPGTDEGKEAQRELRKQKGTWRQLRHQEDETRLLERNRLKEEKMLAKKAADYHTTSA